MRDGGVAAEGVPTHKLLRADASRNWQKQRLGLGGIFPQKEKTLPSSNEGEGQRFLCT